MDSKLDKDAFCEAYRNNKDGLAEKIQLEATLNAIKKEKEKETKYQDTIASLKKQVDALKKKLEVEEEWKPYLDPHNVSKEEYEKLAAQKDTFPWLDCRSYLAHYFGFSVGHIRIIESVPVYEINRHRKLRQVGTRNCPPLYNASDWNYIRFDCGCMSYELYNGELRLFS